MTIALSLAVSCLCAGPGAPEATTMLVDDFPGGLDLWQSSTSPEYYKGGQGRQGLTIETVEGQRCLRAAFGFGNPLTSEPIFITRRFQSDPARMPIQQVKFRYRFEVEQPAGQTVAPLQRGGFLVRLRTSPTAHTNYVVPQPKGGYPVGQWVDATVETNLLGPHVRNIYGTLFSELEKQLGVTELTFRLDDIDDVNARAALYLADIRFELVQPVDDQPYTPVASARKPGQHLRVLDIPQSSDGYYRIPDAAKRLDPKAEVLTSTFHGLHFPIWEFPQTRDELLQYDVIFLGDVDPWVLTNEQLHNLADAVHSGVGLLIAAGPNSFGAAKRRPPALLELLPVTSEKGKAQATVNARPEAVGTNPLVRDFDPAWLGLVRRLVPVTPKAGAEVVLTAKGQPLLVLGQAGRGKVAVLTSWAQPGQLDDGSFMVNDAWQPFAARLLAWLSNRRLPAAPTEPRALPETRLTARWLYSKSAFLAGGPFGLVVNTHRPDNHFAGQDVTVQLERGGEVVWSAEQSVAEEVRFDGIVPDLQPGPIQAVLRMPGATNLRLDGSVVKPLDRDHFFPIITYLPTGDGGHSVDQARVDAKVAEVYDHGFNTIAVGGLGSSAGGGLAAQLRGYAEASAARRDMASILEYTSFTFYRRNTAYKLSPWDDGFATALEERLATGIEQAKYVPRLLSVKYVDEPFVSPANLVDTPAAREAFQRLTGLPWMTREEVGDDPARRYAYGRFLSAWVQQDFTVGQELKAKVGAPWDLLQTYCSPGFGGGRPLDGFEDSYRWTIPADRFDFDVYPYFYPKSDRIRFVEADWCLTSCRVISRRLGKPWGFYIELDDRNYPYQINPPEATAECAFQAVASGADYLNSFILRGFGSGVTSRPERWEKAGQALRAIRAIGPQLCGWQRQPSRVGVMLPETHFLIRNTYDRPLYTRALLSQATGDADVIHEAIFAERPPEALQVLVMTGADFLSTAAAAQLLNWVKAGGSLLLDRVPGQDEHGAKLTWPAAFEARDAWTSHGDGAVMVLSEPLEEQSREAVEGDAPDAWLGQVARLRSLVWPRLHAAAGVASITVESDPRQVDVGLRRDDGSAGLFVLNHAAEAQHVVVKLSDLPFAPKAVTDLTTGQPLNGAVVKGRTLRLELDIPARWAALVGLRR